MREDAELLRAYAEQGADDAFTELVSRHVKLVYFSALRQVGGDTHLAQDITQRVFTALARKSAALSNHEILAAWLFTTTRYLSVQVVRSEQRRRKREQKAHAMNELLANEPHQPEWDRLRAVLDDVLANLGQRDRTAILLRFFEARPFIEVGTKLKLTDDAARMCVDRALERMRLLLSRRGVTSTTSALALLLTQQANAAAPSGLAVKLAGAALAGAASAGTGAGLLSFMGITKLHLGALGAMIAVGGATLFLQTRANATLRHEIITARHDRSELANLQAEQQRLAAETTSIADELAMLRSEESELHQLRDEVSARRRPAVIMNRGRAQQWPVPAEWRNLGTATPTAAFETWVAAFAQQDLEAVASTLLLDPATSARAQALQERMAGRAVDYGTPEKLIATGLLANEERFGFQAERPDSTRIQAVTLSSDGDDTVTFNLQLKSTGAGTAESLQMRFARTPSGWRALVPAALANRILKNF